MRRLLPLVLFMSGCGQPLPETYGDLAEQFAAALCQPLVDCYSREGMTYSQCEREAYNDFCQGEGVNCARAIDTGATTRGEWNECLNDLEALSCSELDRDNWLPRSCRNLDF